MQWFYSVCLVARARGTNLDWREKRLLSARGEPAIRPVAKTEESVVNGGDVGGWHDFPSVRGT